MTRAGAWRRRCKAIARWFRLAFAAHPLQLRCADCGRPLSYLEMEHYGHTCERCEGDAFNDWNDDDHTTQFPET